MRQLTRVDEYTAECIQCGRPITFMATTERFIVFEISLLCSDECYHKFEEGFFGGR